MKLFVSALSVAVVASLSVVDFAAPSSSTSEVQSIDKDYAVVARDYHQAHAAFTAATSRAVKATKASQSACDRSNPNYSDSRCSAASHLVVTDAHILGTVAPELRRIVAAYQNAKAYASKATARTSFKTLKAWLAKENADANTARRYTHPFLTAVAGVRG